MTNPLVTKIVVPFLWVTALLGGISTSSVMAQTQPAVTQSTVQWQPFTSDKGGFTVTMPGKPTEQKQTLNTAAGNIDTYLFSTALNNGANYTVSYLDLPKGAEALPESVLLEAIAGGIAGDDRGKLLSERVIKLDNYNGRELKVQSQAKSIVLHRAFVVKGRIYQIAVEVPAASEERLAGDMERFLNSFKLL